MKHMKDILIKNKILFWPGIGQDNNILKTLKKTLYNYGYEIENINIKYDKKDLNPSNWKQVMENNASWWLGISLGASLLYYAYSFIPKENRPTRITLINPFSSRIVLSKEKNFDINKYWNFSPIEFPCFVKNFELILSTYDTNISPYHGLALINNTNANYKTIISITSDHVISNLSIQKYIARVLHAYKKGKYTYEKKLDYCNIYQQK